MKIIDMTGRDVEEVAVAPKRRRFALLDKLNKTKNVTKVDLKASMARKEYTQNRVVELEHAEVALEMEINAKKEEKAKVELFKEAFEGMTNDFESASKLYEEYPDEYRRFEVSRKLSQSLLPTLSTSPFSPSETPSFDLYLTIRNILTLGKQDDDSEPRNEDLMYALFAKYWLP